MSRHVDAENRPLITGVHDDTFVQYAQEWVWSKRGVPGHWVRIDIRRSTYKARRV